MTNMTRNEQVVELADYLQSIGVNSYMSLFAGHETRMWAGQALGWAVGDTPDAEMWAETTEELERREEMRSMEGLNESGGVTQSQRELLYMFIRDIQKVCATHGATLYVAETRPGRILVKVYDPTDNWAGLESGYGEVRAAGVVERITPRRMKYMDVEVGEI